MYNFVIESQIDELIQELEKEKKKRFQSEKLLKQLHDEYLNLQKQSVPSDFSESSITEVQNTSSVIRILCFIKEITNSFIFLE